MNRAVEKETLRHWAYEIVIRVAPEDTFVVEDGFDALADDWHRAGKQDEGRFIGGVDPATFVGLVVPFLVGLFGDVVKDIATSYARDSLGALFSRIFRQQVTDADLASFETEIARVIDGSRFGEAEKQTLMSGFTALITSIRERGA